MDEYDPGASARLIDEHDSARFTHTTKRDFSRDECKEEFPTIVLSKSAMKDIIVESKALGVKVDHKLLSALKDDEKILTDGRSSRKVLRDSSKLSRAFMETKSELERARSDRIRAIFRSIRRLQNISLCFLIDCTGSMDEHINAVKLKIAEIIESLKKERVFVQEVAFVGYRDHEDLHQYEILDFVPSENLRTFSEFVSEIKAEGGDDGPEDVLGGLAQALRLNWSSECGGKVLIHMADYPAHGIRFTGNPKLRDIYPSGHPSDIAIEDIVAELNQREIYYSFGRITRFTDHMMEEFQKIWHHPIECFEISDPFFLAEKVATAILDSLELIRDRSTAKFSFVREPSSTIPLVKEEPEWRVLRKISGTCISFKIPELTDIIPSELESSSYKSLEKVSKPATLQIAKSPFAKGGERYAYFGKHFRDESKGYDVEQYDVVIKRFIKECDALTYERALEVQTIAEVLAQRFNKCMEFSGGSFPGKIKFLKAKLFCYNRESGAFGKEWCFHERRYQEAETGFLKLLSNDGTRSSRLPESMIPFADLCAAFAEFSYKISGGYLMVTDLQGVLTKDKEGRNVLLLTDPAIHCERTPFRFGLTNLAKAGFEMFKKHHVHNEFCKAELHKVHSSVVKSERKEKEAEVAKEEKHRKYLAEKDKYIPETKDSLQNTRFKYIEFCARCEKKVMGECHHGVRCKFVHEGERCMHNVVGGDKKCAYFRRSREKIKKEEPHSTSRT